MRYALDTNAVIALIARKSDTLVRRVIQCEPGEIGVPAVVAHELLFGAYRSRRVEYNLETLRVLMMDFVAIDFQWDDARASGEIRADLKARGTPIGPYDVLIAGQAKARGLVLVSNNVGEFGRVAGLRVEDWTAL